MMSLNRYRLRHMVKNKHRAAIKAGKLLQRPDRLIGVILIAVGTLLATNQLGWINGQFAFLAEVVVYAEELLQ